MDAVESMIDDIKNQLSSDVGEKLMIVKGHNLKVPIMFGRFRFFHALC